VDDLPLNEIASAADGRAVEPVNLHDVLATAVRLNASDVHLKAGQPPVLRIDGDLAPFPGHGALSTEDLEEVLNTVGSTSPRRVAMFHETGELDTA
jgi:twitching motility protein PilT